MARLRHALLAMATACAFPGGAGATLPGDLCSGNPCIVSRSHTIDAGSVLDFGPATDLRIATRVTLTVGSPEGPAGVVLRAGSITLEPAARIVGVADGTSVQLEALTGGIQLQRSEEAGLARIDASANVGGTIALLATGDILLDGRLNASTTGTDGVAGSISCVSASGRVMVSRDIDIAAIGRFAIAGDLSIRGHTGVIVRGRIDGSSGGGDGASVDIVAADGEVTLAGIVDLSGGSPEGLGGNLDVAAKRGVTISGPILGTGGTGAEEACGDGGEISVSAGTDVVLTAPIILTGGKQCFGGTLDVSAGGSFSQQPGATFSAKGPGEFGGGGAFELQARHDVILRRIDLTSPGFGGFLEVRSAAGTITAASLIDASSGGNFGIGGVIELHACNVRIPVGGRLDTHGLFLIRETGYTELAASRTLRIDGDIRALGGNLLRYRTTPPIVNGTVIPPPTARLDSTLPVCRLETVCGDGVLAGREVCDDGNVDPCDACASDCSRGEPECGDAIIECGEACDDGNGISGDGCETGCRPSSELRRPGAPLEPAGCFVEWMLGGSDTALEPGTGFAAHRQSCTDGDGACDRDGEVNDVCTFEVRTCLRVPERVLPSCSPAPIESVALKQPRPGQGSDPDDANAAAIANALGALGTTVTAGRQVIFAGSPVARHDSCTQPILLKVPTTGPRPGARNFAIGARDTSGAAMARNRIHLECLSAGTRVPGGGPGRRRDCAFEWVVQLGDEIETDAHGIPLPSQTCVDGDPDCDFDATPGTCRFHLAACLGGSDSRLACEATRVDSVRIHRPAASVEPGPRLAARAALESLMGSLIFPVGPGETCTRYAAIDVPTNSSGIELGIASRLAGGQAEESDRLRLRCLTK